MSLTRATSIRMAEALGASRIVTGAYAVDGGELSLSLRLLDVERGVLSAPLTAKGPIDTAADLVDALAWDIALAVAPPPARTRDELFAQRDGVSFEAVKTHAEGLGARGPAARIRTVRRALTLAPSFHPARLSLGRLLLEQREFSAAYETLGRIPAESPVWRSARFLQGVALLEVGRYREAASLYAALAAAADHLRGAQQPGAGPAARRRPRHARGRRAAAGGGAEPGLARHRVQPRMGADRGRGAGRRRLRPPRPRRPRAARSSRAAPARVGARAGRAHRGAGRGMEGGRRPRSRLRDPDPPRPHAAVRADPPIRAALRGGEGHPHARRSWRRRCWAGRSGCTTPATSTAR